MAGSSTNWQPYTNDNDKVKAYDHVARMLQNGDTSNSEQLLTEIRSEFFSDTST